MRLRHVLPICLWASADAHARGIEIDWDDPRAIALALHMAVARITWKPKTLVLRHEAEQIANLLEHTSRKEWDRVIPSLVEAASTCDDEVANHPDLIHHLPMPAPRPPRAAEPKIEKGCTVRHPRQHTQGIVEEIKDGKLFVLVETQEGTTKIARRTWWRSREVIWEAAPILPSTANGPASALQGPKNRDTNTHSSDDDKCPPDRGTNS